MFIRELEKTGLSFIIKLNFEEGGWRLSKPEGSNQASDAIPWNVSDPQGADRTHEQLLAFPKTKSSARPLHYLSLAETPIPATRQEIGSQFSHTDVTRELDYLWTAIGKAYSLELPSSVKGTISELEASIVQTWNYEEQGSWGWKG